MARAYPIQNAIHSPNPETTILNSCVGKRLCLAHVAQQAPAIEDDWQAATEVDARLAVEKDDCFRSVYS